MARNLVICCDGTDNEFGEVNTNVVRLIQSLDRNSAHQRLYYEPGVGTLPEPSVTTTVGKKLSEWSGLAFGTGLAGKVQDAYAYLMETWEPGDQVFIFGFSRGAYAARVLAGALHLLGLLPKGNHHLLPYVMRLFDAVRVSRAADAEQQAEIKYLKLCDEFRWTFARASPDGGDERRFHTHFLGLWDTVSSVGYVWEPKSFRYTRHNPSVGTIRHAVSIDERRCFFRQNLMSPTGGQDLEERWFPGVHSDVGGGYPESEGDLWRAPLAWIMDEANRVGLRIDAARRCRVELRTPPWSQPWAEQLHESLEGWWTLAEGYPKKRWDWSKQEWKTTVGLGRRRSIPRGARIDRAALEAIKAGAYSPPNLSASFLAKVRALAVLPPALPYDP